MRACVHEISLLHNCVGSERRMCDCGGPELRDAPGARSRGGGSSTLLLLCARSALCGVQESLRPIARAEAADSGSTLCWNRGFVGGARFQSTLRHNLF